MARRMAALVAAERSRRAKWRRVRFKDNRAVKPGDTISLGQCWCGEPNGHDWPGATEGQPHPVDLGSKGIPRVPPHILKRRIIEALEEAGVCPLCRGYPPMREVINLQGDTETRPWCELCLTTGTFPPPPKRWSGKSKKPNKKIAKTPEKEGTTMSTTYDAQAVTDLSAALVRLPDNWVVCRDMRHAWQIENDFHVLNEADKVGGKNLIQIGRVLSCLRCETKRLERYLSNGYGLEKIRQAYNYPEGYQIHGVPRGVKPQSIVQQEQYRRAMERAALKAREDGNGQA